MSELIQSIYRLAAPYGRGKIALLFLFSLVQGLFQVAGVTSIFPFLALVADPVAFKSTGFGRRIIEIFPGAGDKELLIGAGVLTVLFLFMANLSLLVGEVVRARYVHGLGHWLRTRVLGHIISNPYPYFLRHNTGELLKKAAGDVMTFVVGILAPFLDLTARVITLILLVVVICWVDPVLCLFMGGTLGLFYWIAYILMKPLRVRTSEGLKAANRGAMREALQAIGGIKPIKLQGVEQVFLKRYSYWSEQQARLSTWIPVIGNSPRYLVEPIAFGAVVGLVIWALHMNADLAALLPTLGVFALAGYRLVPNLQLVYGSLTGITTSLHAMEEIRDELAGCLDSVEDFTKPAASRLVWHSEIALRGVDFGYGNGRESIFKNLNLRIPKNACVAIMGETGCGKSTIADLLLCLLEPRRGTLLVDGSPLELRDVRRYRSGIGVVPQEIFLIDDTLAANVAFGVPDLQRDEKRVLEALEMCQLMGPNGLTNGLKLETRVGDRGVRLSGGQRQRIGLARALYHRPDFLILDEATSALDSETEYALLQAIDRIREKITILVIAHRPSTIQRADIVYRLEKGQLVLSKGICELSQFRFGLQAR